MPYSLTVVLAIPLLLLAAAGAAPADTQPVPDFGLMLNEDGDIILQNAAASPDVAEQNLRRALDTLKTTPVQTLVYQVGCGSDILHYPTKVGSIWGWRKTSKEASKPWNDYLAKMRPAAAAGLDSVRIAAEWSKANDRFFIPSYRMNDAHYCADPMDNPLTGQFWVKHHERLELKESPVPEVENYKHLLDFSKSEVRAYRMAILVEMIERYQDVMQGIQLDFMRHPALFPKGTAQRHAPLLTEMIRQLRRKLDEVGHKNGRTYALMVRVPPTLKHCRNVGIDVERWLGAGLVDVVTPSPAMTISHDMPLTEFLALAEPVGAKVYPAVLDRTQFAWPFTFDPTPASYTGVVTREVAPALLRGAASNYKAMGAAGFELYNFNVPLSAEHRQGVAGMADPMAGDRIYAITPRFWIDTTDHFEPVKQIPATLQSGRPVRLTLWIGEDLAIPDDAPRCALRLGLNAPEPPQSQRLSLSVNGRELYAGPLAPRYTPVTGRLSRGNSQNPPAVVGYVQFPIETPGMFKSGLNELVVEVVAKAGESRCVLSEVQLAVRDRVK